LHCDYRKLHCDYRKLHCDYRNLYCCLGLTALKSTNHSRVIFLCILLLFIIIGSIIRYQPEKNFKNEDSPRPLTAPFALSLNLCYTLLLAIVPILIDLLGDKTQS
jgi:uncharacterized membrane protein YidH (DUF202 family)